MPPIRRFSTPAHQQDFADDPAAQEQLDAHWSANLGGFTRQGIVGNPWTARGGSDQTAYYDPLTADIPAGAQAAAIQWQAFPGRIAFYFPTLSPTDVLSLGDTGYQTDKQTFPNITRDPCSGATIDMPYGPYGPRGWQDEYCEWSVVRDPTTQKILRIDFTCENPEYWNSVWMVDPQRVCDLYRSTLGKPQIELADLYLCDASGQPIIDPSTGRPAYNPLNRWNSGPFSTDTQGGAMHLTSTPNTLQTEINLAASSTVQRNSGNVDPTALICCSQYGQAHRNSDPHIGQVGNILVSQGNTVSLTDPPGLYIQEPDFAASNYAAPGGADPASFWTVVRGRETLADADGNPLPGNFILHATYAVPAALGFTVSDITINNQPIEWAGQIAQTMSMQILATPFAASAPAAEDCVGAPTVTLAQPLQMFHAAVFTGLAGVTFTTPVGIEMNLASNSTLIAPIVRRGQTDVPMVITCGSLVLGPQGQLPSIGVSGDGDVTAVATATASFTYAVPGNTYPSEVTALHLTVSASPSAATGPRDITITNYGQTPGPAMPALLDIQPEPTGTQAAV